MGYIVITGDEGLAGSYNHNVLKLARAYEISETFVRLFRHKVLDDVYIIFTEMISPLHLEPRKYKLLPLDRDSFPNEEPSGSAYQQTVTYWWRGCGKDGPDSRAYP